MSTLAAPASFTARARTSWSSTRSPRVVRHAVLFAAVDNLPVGENIQICAPHQPEPLFAHLQDSEQHYRVETLEVGPVDWRYRITRLA